MPAFTLQRPWSEFIQNIAPPRVWSEVEERLLTNLVYFKTNYFIIALFVFVYSLYAPGCTQYLLYMA